MERVALRTAARPCARFRDALPAPRDVDAAVAAAGRAWKRPSVVAFQSVDGHNTAGVCAVAVLVDVCGAAPADALAAATARAVTKLFVVPSRCR